jgi:hypothetical protein
MVDSKGIGSKEVTSGPHRLSILSIMVNPTSILPMMQFKNIYLTMADSKKAIRFLMKISKLISIDSTKVDTTFLRLFTQK